jgi:uncharacterized coiled-coil protein SlyX
MRNAAYFILTFVAWAILGCVSRAGADRDVLEHQRQVIELEARNTELERRLASYDSAVAASINRLEALGARSGDMEGTIDEVISLFAEYQRAVEQLARDYYAIADTTGTED